MLNGGGHNVYEFDYIAHGGGYWCGLGFARDFAGDNQYLARPTRPTTASRSEPQFQRFGCGFGCHYSLGFCFADAGNNYHRGTIMNQGFGWDCSVGVLCDFGGNRQVQGQPGGNSAHGQAPRAAWASSSTTAATTTYVGYGQGFANPGINYHDPPQCGGNFSFLVDYGGKSTFGCGAQSHAYMQPCRTGGFLIDRPRQDEVKTVSKPIEKTAARQ